MIRILANLLTALLVIWTVSVAISSLSGLTIYFPFKISPDGYIPIHRQEAVRTGVMLTFAHYGILHLFSRNTPQLPVNFLITFLFYLVTAGLIIFQRRGVPIEEYYVAGFWAFCFLLLLFASRPLIKDYFRWINIFIYLRPYIRNSHTFDKTCIDWVRWTLCRNAQPEPLERVSAGKTYLFFGWGKVP